MKTHVFKAVTNINKPINEVFTFFSKAENLNQLTPPELSFSIKTPLPIYMAKGTIIDYNIKLNGIPFSWKTHIKEWQPPFIFVDEQVKGPYKIWHHTHSFKDLGNGTTEMTDTVKYLSPGWILEPLINKLFVQQKVKDIFAYRKIMLEKIFS